MEFFIDSCVLIGAKMERDKWHKLAKPILEYIAEGKTGTGYLLDYVLLETVNFLLKEDGPDVAVDALMDLLASRFLRLIVVDEIGLRAAVRLMRKYRGLSLTDAVIVHYMRELGVKYLISFDSRFDIVPWLVRIKGLDELKCYASRL